jgi:hypothetical protein
LSLNISVAREIPYSTGIGLRAEEAYSEVYSV